MGRHRDPDTLAFINWLKEKGEELGFISETEYSIGKGDYDVDLVWKLHDDQDPLVTFEIETTNTGTVFSNTSKIFGTRQTHVQKPWRHFMIVYKKGLTGGQKEALHYFLDHHNIFLYENVFNDPEVEKKIEKNLDKLKYDLPNLLKRYLKDKSLGESLPLILENVKEVLKDGSFGEPRLTLEVESKGTPEDGMSVSITLETPKGEPLLFERLSNAVRTGKPVEVETPELKSMKIGGKELIPKGSKDAKLVIVPKLNIVPVNFQVANSNIILERVPFRLVRQEGSLICMSTEDRYLPLSMELCIDNIQQKGSCRILYDYDKSTPLQTIQYEEFITAFNKEKELLLINPENGNEIGRIKI